MNNLDNAHSQAIAQAQSVAAMVAALNVDYDRLEELREMSNDESLPVVHATGSPLDAEELGELHELLQAAGDCKDADEARERITEDALSVEVREDWKRPGESATPSEFMVLLSTGGPACRIIGTLDEYLQPVTARIEFQDWFQPWTVLEDSPIDQDTLLQYCQQFYFGE